ncbi:hypothetical protein BKA65DRAFT_482619 [Rhexocercosporidium sp. MPI-PUGE-AT-0058]|nr:hypothetical protein BKA65DRAFT_482619 [Rhexocercosporidium sp. MPI-PUGE-AT-0058]
MLRFMRPRRSLISMSRLPLKTEAQYQRGEIAKIQRVRFKKQRPKPKTIFIYILTAYVGASVYSSIVLDPLERAAIEALQNLPAEELEEEPAPLFIPFPGTTKQLPPVPYRASDPEWQEFVKFSKDKVLAQKVREELAAFVQSVAVKHPILSIRCGKEMKLRRYWLDVDFPQAPPPGFERKGLEIGDNYIELRTQPVDSLTVFRIRQALWPSALMKSFWSFTKVMVVDDAKRIAGMLGIRSGPPPPSLDQLLARHQQLLNKGPQAPQLSTKDNTPTQAPAVTQTPKGMPGTSAEKPALMGKGSEEEQLTSKAMAFHAHFFRPIMAFKAKLAQTWRPAPSYPPRGSISVSGMVELDSTRAWLVFDVRAAWDPKTKEYDPRSMHIQLRRLQPKKQSPVK